MNKFTRQETMALTESTSSQLSYLDRMEIVVPEKYGVTKKPVVLYSWEQVLQICILNELRQQVSNEISKDIVKHIAQFGFESNPKHLAVIRVKNACRDNGMSIVRNTVVWVNDDCCNIFDLMKGASNLGAFTLIFLPNIPNLIDNVWQIARSSSVVEFQSFERRAKNRQVSSKNVVNK